MTTGVEMKVKPRDCDHCYCGECYVNGKRHAECCMCGARKVNEPVCWIGTSDVTWPCDSTATGGATW